MTTPNINEVLSKVIEAKLLELNTSIPAEILSYDHGKNLAVVKPTLKRKYKDEAGSVELPTISNVPVAFPRMGSGHLRIPINKGDTGQIIFNQRSIDKWLKQGGIVDPLDGRRHSLSDAVFYPGLNPNNKPMESSAAPDSIELKLNNAYIEILKAGKFKITDGNEELLDLVSQLAQVVIDMNANIQTSTTNTTFGPMKWNDSAVYSGYESAAETIKGKVDGIKG